MITDIFIIQGVLTIMYFVGFAFGYWAGRNEPRG